MKTYTIELFGAVVAKKNRVLRGKSGVYTYGRRTHDALDRLALQIPGNLRALKLRHPDMEIEFTVTAGRSDRDNFLTSVLDLLVRYGVIAQDNIANFNGSILIHPAVRGTENRTVITLRDTGIDRWQK